MASHKIKIEGVADFSSISKEIENSSKTVDSSFGKGGIKLIDDNSLKALKNTAENTFGKMSKQLEKLKKEAKELDKAIKSSTGDEKKQELLTRQRFDNVRKILSAEKSLSALKRSGSQTGANLPNNVIQFPGKGKTSFAAMAGRQVSTGIEGAGNELPGISAGISVGSAAVNAGKSASSAGLGSMAIAGLGALGAAAAAAAIAVSRMVAGFEAFKEVVPDILQLSGMGINPLQGRGNRAIQGAEKFGYAEPDVLRTQGGLNRAFGQTQNPRQEENRVLNTLIASRSLGLNPEQVSSGGNQLRTVGGTESAQRQMAAILDKAITSGMDKSQASAYLSSAVGLLTDINQNGTANTNELLASMADLVSKGNMSPEQAAKSLGGLNSAISGSSGESNAFFQTAAARGGLGGGSLLGTQFAVRQGLTGVDMNALQKQIGDTQSGKMGIQAIQEMGLGDKNFGQQFAGDILQEINKRFNTNNKEGRQASLGFVGQMFGQKTAPEAAKTLALLEKISKGSASEKDKKLLESLTKDPQENWRSKTLENLDAIARATAESAAASKNAQIDLGKAASATMNSLTNAMTQLDGTLAKILLSDTFKNMASGIGDAANMIKNAFKDIINLPTNLGNMMGDIMSDPLEFGRTMGKGIVEILSGWWEGAQEAFKGLIQSLQEIFNINPGDKAKDVLGKVGGAVSEVGQGIYETGKDVINGFMQGSIGSFANTPMGSPAKGQMGQQIAGAANSGTTIVNKVDNSGIESKLDKTNALLERAVLKPGSAPTARRDLTRP